MKAIMKNGERHAASAVDRVGPVFDFLGMPPEEADAILRPFLVEEIYNPSTWRRLVSPIHRKIVKDAVKRFLAGGGHPAYGRTEADLVRRAGNKWAARGVADGGPLGSTHPIVWSGRHFLLNSAGVSRLYIARLMRLIEKLRPRRVLELGYRNGEKLLLLACRFPETEFLGIDVRRGSLRVAREAQGLARLPDWLVEFSPEPLQDVSAHRRVRFDESSMRRLPFADGSVDLIYTSLAMVQMESFKEDVFAEIGRVSCAYASFFEPFLDLNSNVIQKLYIYADNHFRADTKVLHDFGFVDIRCFANLPQKVWMNTAHVVASKDGIPSATLWPQDCADTAQSWIREKLS